MWSVVFIAASLFAIAFAVVSYSMREVRRRERRVFGVGDGGVK